MPILSKSAGTVIAVWGKAFYHLPNGKLVAVKVGDHIKGGEAILTSQDGIVKITLDDGPNLLLKAKLAAADTDKVITGLNNDELDFSTAAGLQGGGAGGLTPGLRVDRVSESVTGQTYEYSTERGAPTPPLASAEQPLYPAIPVPALSVVGESAIEGQPAVFHVQLSSPATDRVAISLTLKDGIDNPNTPQNEAAKVGTDTGTTLQYFNQATGQWQDFTGELVFQPGESSVDVRVLTTTDNIKEPTENFTLEVHVNSGSVQNTDASGQATLLDNNTTPELNIAGPGVVDEHAGTITYTVTLDHPSATPITVDYAAQDGTATLGSDYQLAPGTLTFAAGETTKTITVGIEKDTPIEGDETFSIVLGNPSGATVGTGAVETTIHEAPILRVISEPAIEGDYAVFSVQLSWESKEAITFKLALADGPSSVGPVATEGQDYVGQIEYLNASGQWVAYLPGSELSFNPGDTEVQVRVPTIDDSVKEAIEFFSLNATVTGGVTQNAEASNADSLIDNEGPDLTAQLDPASDSGAKGDGVTNDTTPTISGTGDPGTAIKVVIPGTGEELTATVGDDGTWSVTPTVSIPDGTKGDVQVTGTDPKGDTTTTQVPLSIDTGVPNNGVAPTVTIVEDANNDGFVDRAELNGEVDVQVAFTPAQASVGDVVKVTSGGPSKDVTITQPDLDKGFVTTSFAAPANGTTITVTAHIEDAAGNRSSTGTDSAKLDLSTLDGLGIIITTDANNDGFINKTELAGSPTAEAQIKLPPDAVAGDLLTVTSTGGTPQTITLTQAQVDAGQVLVSVAVPASGTDLVVTAQVSDAAGNQSVVVSDQAAIATDDISAPKVTIGEDANNDGYINKAELSGSIDVSVALPATAKAGDSLLVSINGTAQTPIVLTQADINASSVSVPGITNPGEGSTLTVTAQVKDVAGNLGATGSDSAVVDTTPATVLTAQLDPASDSGTKGDGITNDATPTISGTGEPGAQIKVTLPGSTEVLTTVVGTDGTWTVTPTQNIPNGTSGQADVIETDAAGNTTQTKVPLTIDTGVPNGGDAPVVTITEDANNDGFINKAELNGNVDVKVAFNPAQVSAGDVVKITSGGVTKDVTLTNPDLSNGFVTTSFAAPANGTTITVTSHIEDKAGNVSATGTDGAKLDLSTLNGLGIAITTDANDDGFINKTELGAGNQVTALVKLPIDAAAGDALSITATGNATQTIILTQAQINDGQVPVSLSAPASGTDLVVSAQVKDAAGNQSAVVSDHAIIATDDISAPKVTITTDANNDGFINKAELGSGSTIGVQIDLPGTAKAGDSLLVSVNGAPQAPIVLNQSDIDNHSVSIPGVNSPGDGNTLGITAQIKDVAGNLGATGSDSAKIDATNYSGLGISITTDGNNDGYISKAELTDNTIGVRVTLPVGAAAGDTLTVTGSGNVAQVITLTGPQLTAGFVDLKFNPTGDNTDFVSSASIADAAGNAAGPVSDAARLQLGAPGAPIVTIGE
ncbi:Calx-beta domain-containing protein, partial [Aquabacterium sp.]|uniref:Calx-beta domain-containing protein n=1 Tax=Aquabacterium sp. TaxID=1872578 RepID=UPI003D6D9D22